MGSPPAETAVAEERPGHEGESSFVDTARGLWQDERVEIVAAILLALATVLSAWGAYQATRWSGEQADAYAESAALRANASRQGGHRLAADPDRRHRLPVLGPGEGDRRRPAGRLPPCPFQARIPARLRQLGGRRSTGCGRLSDGHALHRDRLHAREPEQADDLNAQADAALAEARYDNQISDNFVLTAVLFASVLFFAGTAAKFRPQWIRWSMIAVAVLVFGLGIAIEFTLPQSIGF